MYKKLVVLSPFLIPPKKMREEWKDKEVAKQSLFYYQRFIHLLDLLLVLERE